MATVSVQVDKRAGSINLVQPLRQLGVEVEETILNFGDCAFMGYAANGAPASFGVEVKSVEDIVSCLHSGRFSGFQLPGLIASYDYVWLLITNEYRARARDGVLEYKKEGRGGGQYWSESCGRQRTVFWRDLESYLMTCQIMGGIRIHTVADYHQAAAWLKLVSNWAAKEDHKSHRVIYGSKELFADHALLVKPTLARRVAAQLPQIGERRSADVARAFPTLAAMVEASPKDWATKVEGIGKGIAAKVYTAIHQNGNGPK
jgi:ERCC4-type nuclease